MKVRSLFSHLKQTRNRVAASKEERIKYELLSAVDGSPRANVTSANSSDIQLAVKNSQTAQQIWHNYSTKERAEILCKASSILSSKFEEVAQIEVMDTGRCISEIRMNDIPSAVHILSYYAHLPGILSHGSVCDVHSSLLSYTHREPLGVTAGIGAWNFPFLNAVSKSAPALVFGNSMIYKPSELTPSNTLVLADIYQEAGMPEGVFQVLLGDGHVAAEMIHTEHVRKISFTGSLETGQKIYKNAAEHMQKVTLELGGKSPLIIMPDCDIDKAVQGAIDANFYANGQVCSNGTRVFVHESIKDDFLASLVLQTEKLKLGDPMNPATNIGPMISKAHMNKVLEYIRLGKEVDGATLVYGGEKLNSNGNFITPCIFADCHDGMTIVQEEVFGMLMSVLTFQDIDEVVARANATKFGLAAGIYTNDTANALKLSKRLQVGNVYINTYNEGPCEMPWGGIKKSGIGREGGSLEALYEWTECKSVYVNIE
jgi:acyl-CoA reductase-like NAD-dependent aldehyde dehydrogenase